MFAHLSTTLEGLFLIRLYHTEERFDYFNSTLIDADDKALYSLLLGFNLFYINHFMPQFSERIYVCSA